MDTSRDVTDHRPFRLALLAAFVVLVLVAAACADDDPDDVAVSDGEGTPSPEPTGTPESTPEPTSTGGVDDAALDALDRARARWDARGLDTYAYEWTRYCECLPEHQGPFRVVVTDAAVTEMTAFGEPAPGDVTRRTVQDMYDEIEAAIRSGVEVSVTYDDTDGHPLRVDLDLDAIAVDGGTSYEVVNLFPTGEVRDRLDEARARWDAADVDSYDLVYREMCFCPEIVVSVSVRDGEIVDYSIATDFDADVEVRTVEDLFDEIAAALELPPASISLEVDEELGHPVSYFIDEETFIADEEHGVTIESLTPVA